MTLIGRRTPVADRVRSKRRGARVFYEGVGGMLEEGWYFSRSDGPPDGPHVSKDAARRALDRYIVEKAQ